MPISALHALLLVTGLIQQRPPARRRAAAWSRPATANPRTAPIAAIVSHDARFSNRCVRSGVRSPTCRAGCPFRFGRSLITAATYFPACSHDPARSNAGLSCSSSSAASADPAAPTP